MIDEQTVEFANLTQQIELLTGGHSNLAVMLALCTCLATLLEHKPREEWTRTDRDLLRALERRCPGVRELARQAQFVEADTTQ